MTPKLMALPDGAPFLVTTDAREVTRAGALVVVVDGYQLAPSCCELCERGPDPRFKQGVPAAELVELDAAPHGEPQRVREARERGREPRAPRGQAEAAPAKRSKRARG